MEDVAHPADKRCSDDDPGLGDRAPHLKVHTPAKVWVLRHLQRVWPALRLLFCSGRRAANHSLRRRRWRRLRGLLPVALGTRQGSRTSGSTRGFMRRRRG
eukprot:4272370-Alexandrium_andersonii.AAC.1